LVASEGDASWSEIFHWTNRQLILTKVYFPELWRRAIARASIMGLWLVLILSTFVLAIIFRTQEYWLALAMGLSLLPIELLFLLRAQRLWRDVLKQGYEYHEQPFLTFCMALPLAHLVLPWMTLYSLLTNRIEWRGVSYELRSPNEILVLANP
jgi:hypothetical protein